jgi:hypothetical protein
MKIKEPLFPLIPLIPYVLMPLPEKSWYGTFPVSRTQPGAWGHRRLFVSQRHRGIDAHRPPCWHCRRQRNNHYHHQGHAEIRHPISSRNTE